MLVNLSEAHFWKTTIHNNLPSVLTLMNYVFVVTILVAVIISKVWFDFF